MAQDVRIPRQGGDIGGILSVPDGKGPFPGGVMIPTIMGLNDFAKHVVDRLATEGFVALGVNIFDRPDVPQDPFKRPGSQPDERVLGDLNAGLAMLKGHARVNPKQISAWGYCIGGRFAMLWPTYQPELSAAAGFHGFPTNDTSNPNTPTEPAGRVSQLTVPIFAAFGEADALVPMAAVNRYRDEVTKHGKDVEIQVYEGCDHGWTAPGMPKYNQKAAEECWAKAIQFIRNRIGK
jgi:carboxymethylenebutenolidase